MERNHLLLEERAVGIGEDLVDAARVALQVLIDGGDDRAWRASSGPSVRESVRLLALWGKIVRN